MSDRPPSLPYRWDFVESPDMLHRWHSVRTDGATRVSDSFASLELAKADAIRLGFDPDTETWTVTAGGRTTHFRPGRIAVNLPSDEAPPE
jgi:hypothetical protein